MTTTILCLAGPTAAGKSACVAELAARWPVDIVNVDSATIYRGMDIGTAKPSKAEQARIAHHLLDIRDPAESYSAADFRHDALQLITDSRKRGRTPVLCGGTMLYYKALRDGLNDLPRADPAVRADIDQQARQAGWPAMHRQLARFDAATAARLAPNDSQRIQRAIEVYRLTGKPLSALLTQRPTQPQADDDYDYDYATISLEPSDRKALHARIARRYQAMVREGLVDEVARLHQRPDLHPGLPSVRCVGYRQLWDYLNGDTTLDAAIDQAIAATRRLAKRQLTWLRAQPERRVIDCLDDNAAALFIDAASKFLP